MKILIVALIGILSFNASASEKFCKSNTSRDLTLDFDVFVGQKLNDETTKMYVQFRKGLIKSLADFCKSSSLNDDKIINKMFDECFKYTEMNFSKIEKDSLNAACYSAARAAVSFTEGVRLTEGAASIVTEECDNKKNSLDDTGRSLIKTTQELDRGSETKNSNAIPK